MQIIIPKPITDAVLISTNVPETDVPAWNNITAYAVGQQVIDTHNIYQCVNANTGAQPSLNLTTTTPAWMLVGATNARQMFDDYVNTLTTKSDGIQVVLDFSYCDSVALFNLSGSSLLIELLSGGDVVNAQSFALSKRNVGDYYDYFLEEFEMVVDVSATLPIYFNSQLRITVNGAAACGNAIIGRTKYIGNTIYDPRIGALSFSKKITDQNFGKTYLQKGPRAKRGSIIVEVENNRIDYVYKLLDSIDGTAAVFLCDNGPTRFECMQVYGFIRDYYVTINGPILSKLSLEIEGLI